MHAKFLHLSDDEYQLELRVDRTQLWGQGCWWLKYNGKLRTQSAQDTTSRAALTRPPF